MSSSRRSSQSRKSRRAERCPICGKQRLVKTVGDVVIRAGRRKHRFENVPHEECGACGERIFNLEASRQFDAVFLKGRRRAA